MLQRYPSIRQTLTGKSHLYLDESDDGDDEQEFEIEVEIDYHEWSEGHPYGDTTAYERLSDWDLEAIYLDGQPVSMDDLRSRFGDEQASEALDEATSDAVDSL